MKKVFKTAVKLTAAAAVVAGATAANAGVDFGKRGEKVDLVIGYQPYYTESWTGVVNNGKAFCLASLTCGLYRNRNIIQKTKTIWIVWQAMMARRA